MSSGSISRRYARALLELGAADGSFESLGRQVSDFSAAMEASDDLRNSLLSPIFGRSERRKVVDRILTRLGAASVTRNFFHLLLDRERLAVVPGIARELSRMIDERLGRATAEVASALPLSTGQQQQLKQSLEGVSGKTVTLDQTIDPDLLGGVVAKVGDVTYDGSLRTQLERLRSALTQA